MANENKEKRLKALNAKREALFRRVQTLYDCSKKLTDQKAIDLFRIKYQSLEETKKEYSEIIDSINLLQLEIDPSFNPEYVQLDAFIDLCSSVKLAAVELFRSDNVTPVSAQLNSGANSAAVVSARLPKIELPKFSGDLQEWATFYEIFKNKIHLNDSLSLDDKVYYLVGRVVGRAASVFSGIPPTASNYGTIWNALVDRYEDIRMQANFYMKQILEFKAIHIESEASLKQFLDRFDAAISSLKNLKLHDLGDFILGYIAVSKLDSQTIRNFELSRENKRELPTYTEVLEFVKMHSKFLSHTSSIIKHNVSGGSTPCTSRAKVTHSFVLNENNYGKCIVCNTLPKHPIYRCLKFKDLTPHERYNVAKEKSLCLNCLSNQHQIKFCKSKDTCSRCHAKHHTMLHFEKDSVESTGTNSGHNDTQLQSVQSSDANATFSACASTSYIQNKITLLPTAVVNFIDSFGIVHKIRMLLDSASESNFLTATCCRRLRLSVSKIYTSVLGMGGIAQSIRGQTNLVIHSNVDSSITYNMNCFVVDKIVNQLPTSVVNMSSLKYLEKLPLADIEFYKPSPVDGIIGAELYAHLLGSSKVIGPSNSPIALETSLGFVVMGTIPSIAQRIENPCQIRTFCTFDASLENLVKKFWEIEDIADTKRVCSKLDEDCESNFKATHSREPSGRYVVSLPFKDSPALLGDSQTVARRRFLSLEKRLQSSDRLKESYSNVMQDYLNKGHMHLVAAENTVGPAYYIPHHAVIREDHATTPVRVVFDASAKSESNLSLNDILHTGEKLQNDLITILLKFRLSPIAFTADIKQMYRQISVVEEHRRYQRIFWRFSPEEKLNIYELSTVTFGIKSSPYLALRVMQQLSMDESNRFPLASRFIRDSMYVDDLCGSVETIDQAKLLFQELVDMCMAGGFPLVKWSTSSQELWKHIPENIRLSQSVTFDNSEFSKVLGLKWNPKTDQFSFDINIISKRCSKRNILSTVARIFDPFGFLAPLTLLAKTLIARLWQLKIEWDENPPPEIQTLWNQFINELPCLIDYTIPRYLNSCNAKNCTLVGFADASQRGYGVVIYFRTEHSSNQINTGLVCAKSKVAPLKILSIPRLELLAACLLARLMKFVIDTYGSHGKIDNVFAFTDSRVVLSWIHSDPNRWKTFVSNRVSELQSNLDSKHWFHVDGSSNPADCVSRGLMPNQVDKIREWSLGPEWLPLAPLEWPIKDLEFDGDALGEEKTISLVVSKENQSPLYDLILKFSNWRKLLNATVYFLRFAKLLPRQSNITIQDLEFAELQLCRAVQLKHFFCDYSALEKKRQCSPALRVLRPFLKDGIIRVGGRISNSNLDYASKHPILLPKRDPFVLLLVTHYHRNHLHTGPQLLLSVLRKNYWIMSGRSLTRQVVRSCNWCFKTKPKATFPLMGDLPSFRVTPAKPFMHTGVDYAGPFHITVSRRRGIKSQKAYICLFVCMVTKAIHLELASDLSTEIFIAAFKRFIARRGHVSVLYSDRGTNFVGAKSQFDEIYKFVESSSYIDTFKNELLDHRIDWKFNPPNAPHMGGLWEANVKSVKSHLFRAIGSQILSYEEFTTVLTQIEALLNSRPLCCGSSDPSEPEPLTPAHFLNLVPLKFLPAANISNAPSELLIRKNLLDHLVQSYWKRWSNDYLIGLQQRQKWNRDTVPIKVGTVVVVMKDETTPLSWPLGVVREVFPGRDGVNRVALVKTKAGIYKRPVVRLCPLPTQ